jgi:hypothetical protein
MMERAMDTSSPGPIPRDIDEYIRSVPTGILSHHPGEAAPGSEHVWPETSGDETPTYLHPAVVIAAVSGYVWFLLVSWVVFFGYGYMGLSLAIATLISVAMLGLIAAGGDGGRNVAPWQRRWRSFGEFLAGDIEVWGGRVPGRDSFVQLAGMAWCLAVLATMFGVITELARP